MKFYQKFSFSVSILRCEESDQKMRAQLEESLKYGEEEANFELQPKVESEEYLEIYQDHPEYVVTEPAEFEYIEVDLEDEKIKVSTESPKKPPQQNPKTIKITAKITQKKVPEEKKLIIKEDTPKPKKSSKAISSSVKCEYCHHKFSRMSLYEAHLKNENCQVSRTIPCTVCDQKFTSKSNMTAHVKFTHNRVKDYYCTTCHKMYSTSTSLKRHILIVHAKVDPSSLSKYKTKSNRRR